MGIFTYHPKFLQDFRVWTCLMLQQTLPWPLNLLFWDPKPEILQSCWFFKGIATQCASISHNHIQSLSTMKNTRCEVHVTSPKNLKDVASDIASWTVANFHPGLPSGASIRPSPRPVKRRWSPSSLRTITRGSTVGPLFVDHFNGGNHWGNSFKNKL